MNALARMQLADALAASTTMQTIINPLIHTVIVLATVACAFYLVVGGVEYMVSRGSPDTLEHAKRTLRNALLGLVLVIAAAAIAGLLAHLYSTAASGITGALPALTPIQENTSTSFWDIVTKAIVHVLQVLIESIGQPFLQALAYFTRETPLMGSNPSVFNLWLVMVGIADGAFVLVVALLGFHLMSFQTLGFDELDLKQLIPQLVALFLLINTSLFAVDTVIGLSNGLIGALRSAFPPLSLWDVLIDTTKQSSGLGFGGLLIMTAFLILTVLLVVYYVGRLITLYVGAVVAPLVILLYALPAFKDFAVSAIKVYLTTIFVLFVQVVIMQLASSIFLGLLEGSADGQPNTLMALIVGLATIMALLKTQGVMKELSYAASAPRAARQITGSFIRGVTHLQSHMTESRVPVSATTLRHAADSHHSLKPWRAAPPAEPSASSAWASATLGMRTANTDEAGEP